jgi:ATP-dependent Clp protease adaptor protein ClpS
VAVQGEASPVVVIRLSFGEMAVDVPVRDPRTAGPGSGSDEKWRVIVLNDDHNTFEGVAAALASTLPGITYERGMALATAIHNRGLAVVWSGHREQAELYWEMLKDYGLTMAPLER